MAEVSIIIPAYNSWTYLQPCLDSISHQTFVDFEVIVLDNGSDDGTMQGVEQEFPWVRLIRYEENKGFCVAVNQGIQLSQGSYILVLNSDVTLHQDCLAELVESAREKPASVGAFSPKILRDDKKTIDSLGLVLSRSRRVFDRAAGEFDEGQHEMPQAIWGVCCAAGFFHRKALNAIAWQGEVFDKDFFFLLEDFDVAWRMRKRGFSAQYVPSATCYHARSVTFTNRRYRQYLSFRNRLLLLLKNEDSRSFLRDWYRIIPYDMVRFPYLLLTNPLTLKAVFEVVRDLPKTLRKRRAINNSVERLA